MKCSCIYEILLSKSKNSNDGDVPEIFPIDYNHEVIRAS